MWAGCGREAACTLQTETVASNAATGGETVRMLAVLQVARNRLGMFCVLTGRSLHCAGGEVPVLFMTHLAGRCCTIALPGPAGVCAVLSAHVYTSLLRTDFIFPHADLSKGPKTALFQGQEPTAWSQ